MASDNKRPERHGNRPQPPRPLSVRATGDSQAEHEGEDDRVRPTPVRRSLGVEAEAIERTDRMLDIDGVEWTVRCVGFSQGGRTVADLHLLEIEFQAAPEDDGEDDRRERRRVVRRDLDDLSDLQLRELLERGASVPD